MGKFILDELVEPKSAQGKADLKRDLEFDLDWRKIRSITAYGPSFQGKADPNGLLLIRTSMRVQPALELALTKDLPTFRVRKIESPAGPLYSINEQGFLSIAPGGLAIVGKSSAAVEKGRSVIDGDGANLASGNALAGYPSMSGSFFFLAVAEGFAREAPLPPKAAILKNAQGGRFLVGEIGDDVLLNLSVRAESPETAQQIQQVVQGLIALATLSSDQDRHLATLARKATVTTQENLVTVGAQIPVGDVLEKLHPR